MMVLGKIRLDPLLGVLPKHALLVGMVTMTLSATAQAELLMFVQTSLNSTINGRYVPPALPISAHEDFSGALSFVGPLNQDNTTITFLDQSLFEGSSFPLSTILFGENFSVGTADGYSTSGHFALYAQDSLYVQSDNLTLFSARGRINPSSGSGSVMNIPFGTPVPITMSFDFDLKYEGIPMLNSVEFGGDQLILHGTITVSRTSISYAFPEQNVGPVGDFDSLMISASGTYTAVPEPTSLVLAAVGAVGLIALRSRVSCLCARSGC